ncbi:MAG: iron-containing alcohol dehydrogenase [Lachnospiraceae bacterium]|nr:iron-containing alcohol dehydrogenase [Lachnospiraceae bacterium]
MQGNFTFHNPSKIYFGKDAVENIRGELPKYGPVVQLVYGGGSIKKNGVYDAVMRILNDCGKTVIDDGGVLPNPTVERLMEGREKARANGTDFILAVGGGSCCDYAKALSVAVWEEDPEDFWFKYYERFEKPAEDAKIVPAGCVLTMVGTGSEMNMKAVLTNTQKHWKRGGDLGPRAAFKFSVLDPAYTLSLPYDRMVAGAFDIFVHLCEQYFSGTDDCVSDDLAEGLMRSVVKNSRRAVLDPQDWEARSNLMWAAALALSTVFGCGKSGDSMVHQFGQSIGAYTGATHGMTLSATILPYYRMVLADGLPKYARFAREVWHVDPAGKTERETAEAGLDALEAWMRELGLVMHAREIGVTEEMIPGLVEGTRVRGFYRKLTREEMAQVYRESI